MSQTIYGCRFCHRYWSSSEGETPRCLSSTPLIPYSCQPESSDERMLRELAQSIHGRRWKRMVRQARKRQ